LSVIHAATFFGLFGVPVLFCHDGSTSSGLLYAETCRANRAWLTLVLYSFSSAPASAFFSFQQVTIEPLLRVKEEERADGAWMSLFLAD